MELKAFHVSPGRHQGDDWCVLVYAKTRGKAKRLGCSIDGNDFTEMSAWRAKSYDKYAQGDEPYVIETNEEMPEGAEPFFNDDILI